MIYPGQRRRHPRSATGGSRGAATSRFEYPVLVILAALGMGIMVSAGDLISLYVGVELQSLALYVLAAFRRDDAKALRGRPEVFRARARSRPACCSTAPR